VHLCYTHLWKSEVGVSCYDQTMVRGSGVAKMGKIDEKALVVRRNELIHAHYRMTLQEQRLLLWLIAQIEPEDEAFTTYRIGVKELAEFIGIERSKNVYTEMAGHTKRLMTRVAEVAKIENGQDTLTQLQFVSKTKYFFGDGVVELCLNEHMRPYVLKLRERFTKVQLQYAIRLSSFYAIRVYELAKCEGYRTGTFEMDLQKFRACLGIADGKLKRSDHFKAKVLDISKREIDDRTDINIDFEWIKRGKSITGIRVKTTVARKPALPDLPGTDRDILRDRLERAGMSRKEALKNVDLFAQSDRSRLTWHLDNMAHKTKPLAWLRAGLKKDYRPQPSLFSDKREQEADRKKRQVAKAKLDRAEASGSVIDKGFKGLGEVMDPKLKAALERMGEKVVRK
jgi:plasmid replication initiation protein